MDTSRSAGEVVVGTHVEAEQALLRAWCKLRGYRIRVAGTPSQWVGDVIAPGVVLAVLGEGFAPRPEAEWIAEILRQKIGARLFYLCDRDGDLSAAMLADGIVCRPVSEGELVAGADACVRRRRQDGTLQVEDLFIHVGEGWVQVGDLRSEIGPKLLAELAVLANDTIGHAPPRSSPVPGQRRKRISSLRGFLRDSGYPGAIRRGSNGTYALDTDALRKKRQ